MIGSWEAMERLPMAAAAHRARCKTCALLSPAWHLLGAEEEAGVLVLLVRALIANASRLAAGVLATVRKLPATKLP
jgi:hexokinase